MNLVMKLIFNKKGEIPDWLMMLIWLLIGLVVVLFIIKLQGGKLLEFLDWLG